MAIVASDIKFRLSGGSSNTNPNASLGGVASSTDLVDATSDNLFDDVTAVEAAVGSIEYRCIYIVNGHGSLALQTAKAYISSLTSSAGTEFDIGLGAAAVNSDETATANETTAPASVTFSRPTDYTGGLALNSTTGLVAGARKAIWIRRTVTAGAAAASDTGTIKIEGDTAA